MTKQSKLIQLEVVTDLSNEDIEYLLYDSINHEFLKIYDIKIKELKNN